MSETQVLERPVIRNKEITSFQKTEIIDKLALETPQREIAGQYGVSQTRISHINQEEEAKVNQKKQELLQLLPSIVETSKEEIQLNRDINKTLKADLNNCDEDVQRSVANKLKFKTIVSKLSQDIMKIAGMFPSQALLNFNQYNQDNRQTNIEPKIMNLFSGSLSNNMQAIDMNEVNDNDDKQ